MNFVTTAAAVVVGVVFVVAGAAKLASGHGWRTSARDLGVPDWLAPIVPWTELTVGALLAVGLFEPAPLKVLFRTWFYEDYRTFFGAVIEAAVCQD